MTGAEPLSPVDLVVAALLVVIAGAISMALRLGLEKRLGIAAVRTIVQLLLVGYVLKVVFDLKTPWAIGLIVAVMLAVASHAAVKRSSRSIKRLTSLAMLSLAISSLLVTYMVTRLIIGVTPWYEPRYMIPLLGMIMGNGLTGISLCLDYLLEAIDQRRSEIEMELAHGATRWEAASRPIRAAVRRGMIPLINAMTVVGLVSLPGMMTGQILQGADPMEAVKYQIVVMFMIAAATSLACIGAAMLVYRRLFNARHQVRADLVFKSRQ